MNPSSSLSALSTLLYRMGLHIRRRLPRQQCHAFGPANLQRERIERIYVINLDRQADRWVAVSLELSQVLDSSGAELAKLAVRYPAVDAIAANACSERRRRSRDSMSNSLRYKDWEATQGKRRWEDVERWIGEAVSDGGWLFPAASVQRMGDGIPNRLDRLRAIGNGQVPALVVRAWSELSCGVK